jgi:hypothetical protein
VNETNFVFITLNIIDIKNVQDVRFDVLTAETLDIGLLNCNPSIRAQKTNINKGLGYL